MAAPKATMTKPTPRRRVPAAVTSHSASERMSRTATKLGPPAPSRSLRAQNGGKVPPNPRSGKGGATVGSAVNAVSKAVGGAANTISKAIPSRAASGIVPSTMKNLPKGGVMGVIKPKPKR